MDEIGEAFTLKTVGDMIVICSRQTHKAWRPLQDVGYNHLFLQGLLPPTLGAETELPP